VKWLCVALACAACGGKLPETRYYQLAAVAPAKADASGQATIAIEPFATDTAYDDERIVYRQTPYRLDYYHYHRWSALPGVMLAGYFEQALERSGKFRAVVRAPATDATFVLGGRVAAIEEIDTAKTRWVGRIALELVLTDAKSGHAVWTKKIEETEPLRVQSPEGLAEALSAAMARVIARITPDVVAIADKPSPIATRPKK
jgi:ABC-type uncharacterized transport system auxiliary subunit